MRKHLILVIFTILLFSCVTRAQDAASINDKKTLTDRIFSLYQHGKYDEAIKLAEKVVKIEENQTDTSSRINAILNLARLRRDNFKFLRNKSGNKNIDVRSRIDIGEEASENALESEKLYLKAIALNESGGRARTGQTADLKSELAWLTYNFFPPTDKPSVANARSRIDEAERLFAESLTLNEEARGRDAIETFQLVLGLGNFYHKYDNYEKALPYYERYISGVETKSGKNFPGLVNALRPYAQILGATSQESEFSAAVKRIEEITGQKENLPFAELDLGLRSKDSVAYHSKISAFSKNNIRQRITNTLVKVTVDETGRIIEASADTKDAGIRQRAEMEVSKWTVRPFIYNGTARKIRGNLRYAEVH